MPITGVPVVIENATMGVWATLPCPGHHRVGLCPSGDPLPFASSHGPPSRPRLRDPRLFPLLLSAIRQYPPLRMRPTFIAVGPHFSTPTFNIRSARDSDLVPGFRLTGTCLTAPGLSSFQTPHVTFVLYRFRLPLILFPFPARTPTLAPHIATSPTAFVFSSPLSPLPGPSCVFTV